MEKRRRRDKNEKESLPSCGKEGQFSLKGQLPSRRVRTGEEDGKKTPTFFHESGEKTSGRANSSASSNPPKERAGGHEKGGTTAMERD